VQFLNAAVFQPYSEKTITNNTAKQPEHSPKGITKSIIHCLSPLFDLLPLLSTSAKYQQSKNNEKSMMQK